MTVARGPTGAGFEDPFISRSCRLMMPAIAEEPGAEIGDRRGLRLEVKRGTSAIDRIGILRAVIKGLAEPSSIYEVTGLGPLRTRLQRAAGRGLTKFVGREREMETLRHAAGLAREGRGQIVAAMAEPGVGKSRLFHEFKATSASGWMVLEALSISHGKASAYLPVLDLLRNYFEISAADDERHHLVAWLPARDVATDGRDLARNFQSGNFGSALRRRIEAFALQDVGPIDSGGRDLD